jgi:DNA-binding winged helix-turn-helix (wHTH) protein/tetratricopeptide (TPR) repeat protein
MSARLEIGDFEIEPATRKLRRLDGTPVHLANRPFRVLLHLVANRSRLVSRAELLEQFWDGRDVYDGALTRCLSTVRKALDDQGETVRYIETRWSEGYRFIGPCAETPGGRPAGRVAAGIGLGGRRRASFRNGSDTRSVDRLVHKGNRCLSRFGVRNQRYALALFRAALEANPDDYRAWAGIAASHSLQYLHAERLDQHWNGAIAAAREALDRRALSAEAQLARAHVAVMRRDFAEADAAFTLAEDLDPRFFQAWYHHGRLLAEISDHDRAVDKYEKAATVNANDCQASALAEESFERLGLHRDARRTALASIESAERTLRRRPDDVRSLSLGGCLLPELGRSADARRWTERAVALEPDEPYVNMNAACCHALLGEQDAALAYLARVPLSPIGNCPRIRLDSSFDDLRGHPRFAEIMANCGKPTTALRTDPRPGAPAQR